MSHKVETIICPSCSHIQGATVKETNLFNVYLHDCLKCNYTIMESEWQPIKKDVK